MRDVWVAGVAETPLGEVHDHSELSMTALASLEALDEAGLSMADVDGLFTNYMGEQGTVVVGEYLGVRPKVADSTDLGGASWQAFVHHALLAVESGACEVALLTYASRQRTRRQRELLPSGTDHQTHQEQFQDPYGLPLPIGHYALMAARHFHEHGTTADDLAEVALAARRWAQLNPKAWARDALTPDDVRASRVISTPLRKADCCLVTDGGGAVVITSGARARDARKRAVRVLGAGQSQSHWNLTHMPDLTTSAAVQSGRDAFGMAGITAADVDVLEPYDSFTITVLMALEDLGFCAKGEGGAFVRDGRLAPGGALPAMTSGGGLSYNHPGALGVLLLVEAVRQLRGECGDRQVAGAEVAVTHGVGGMMSTAGTVVLGRG